MTETARPLRAGIIDFNPRRMTPDEANAHGIPPDLTELLADWRQYPANIARHFPEGISWLNMNQPWYFNTVMENPEQRSRLLASDILITSGSGLSEYNYQHGAPDHRVNLDRSQKVTRDFLGLGKWSLGVCFGGQHEMAAVGGTIGRLPEGVTEAGWLDHMLMPSGQKDPVFKSLPHYFSAPHFHNDYVEALPQVGTKVQTASGSIEVVRADILAVRHGYLDKDGLKDIHHPFIMASLVEFNNGARLYQIQPHPEMATAEKANFLVRMNPWLEKETEMGSEYYQKALQVPKNADFSVAKIIPSFVREAQTHLEKQGITFVRATLVHNILQYLLT